MIGPNRNIDNANSDYSGGNVISSPEELEAYLKGGNNGNSDEGGDLTEEEKAKGKKGKPAPAAAKADDQDNDNPADVNKDKKAANAKDEGNEGDEDDEVEHKSMVHFLNDEFKLGLKVDALPEEFSAAEEAEMVGAIFKRAITGMNAKLAQYKDIDNALKDPEVAGFVKAKLDGKTLKDYVQQYAVSTQGLRLGC
jgi:hypothetical protein